MARKPDLTAHPNPLRAGALLGVWALVVPAGLGALALAISLLAELPLVGLLFIAMAVLVLAAGCVGVLAALDMLRQPAPILTISRDGLRDLRLSDQTIPWEALDWRRALLSTVRANGDTVQLRLSPEIKLRPAARAMALANRALKRPPCSVLTFALEVDAATIAQAMARHKDPWERPTGKG
ncbi:hypothetical protein HUK65_15790 [Rhodobacteraceae bacterium 2376]|uniref:Uncharacterized protein n=1 Tax=Rhabdonatronobacter sediminivivens TaxID=2743469 RepID=A0A7Z0KZI2_9RHOB|nr:hypothetical protein [Rhabdonatronobacter sediminivivens]NYS26449.1 hypothetical protein [Rhabdonatronobacter sediminivivens]